MLKTVFARTKRQGNGFGVEISLDRGFGSILKTFDRADKSKPQPSDRAIALKGMRYQLKWVNLDAGE